MRKILCASGVLIVFCVVLFIKDAMAIPVFARKYKTSCVTCHAPFPKLSAFGEAFRLNGYKIPGGANELYIKEEPLSLGAEAYKKIWPESIWPSTMPGIPPIALRVIGDVLVDTTGTHKNSTEFDFQNEIDVHSGGQFGDHWAYFAEIAFTPVSPGGAETVSTTAAWLMYQDLFPNIFGANHFNIKAGDIGKLEISLPNIRFDNSYQANDYLYASELNLGSQPGFEVNGFDKWWRYAFGITKSDTANSERDYYGQIDFKICGLGYDGSGGQTEAGGLTTSPSGYWVDNSVSFGLFGYRTYDGPNSNVFDRFGGDIRASYENFSLAGGFMRGLGNDTIIPTIFEDPAIQALFPATINENVWTAEARYFVLPWVVPFVRYELVDVTNASGLDKNRIVAGVTMLAVANIRINVEGRYYFKNEPFHVPGVDQSTIDANQVGIRLDWAF
jgi:hypothetical protein